MQHEPHVVGVHVPQRVPVPCVGRAGADRGSQLLRGDLLTPQLDVPLLQEFDRTGEVRLVERCDPGDEIVLVQLDHAHARRFETTLGDEGPTIQRESVPTNREPVDLENAEHVDARLDAGAD